MAKGDKSIGALASELRALVVTYAREQTLDPLKALGRYLLWGAVGALLIGVGGVLVTLGAVRVLQAETGSHLTGHLSFVPYLGGLLVAALILVVTATRIVRSTPSGRGPK